MRMGKRKQKRIEKKLLHKVIKVIMRTPCDRIYSSADILINGFSEVFHSVTKIPVHAWWSDGSPIYLDKKRLPSLANAIKNQSRECGWEYLDQVKGKHSVRHQYYFRKFRSNGRNVFTFAIEESNRHCKGSEFIMRQIAENFFSMTHPFISVWLGERKMNPLKLPDIHSYYNQLHNYYGAIYMRPRNYRRISTENLIKLYQKWMSYFDNTAAFSFSMDTDCLVVLLRYTSSEKSDTDYSATNATDIFNKIIYDSNDGEEPLYDAYSFYNKNDFDQNDLRDLRLTISAYELEHDFNYYKTLKTNHFYSEVTTYTPPVHWSSYQNKQEPVECSLPPELITRYRNRVEKAKKRKKAKELQMTNIKVLF